MLTSLVCKKGKKTSIIKTNTKGKNKRRKKFRFEGVDFVRDTNVSLLRNKKFNCFASFIKF
ncbi:hypothetical protein PAWBP_4390 [Paulownia witches'-broom phytoplasma]|nr:hypothetical protein PAWBP_4390 [Paulownia witches'-broom phytoplasma]